MKPIGVAEALGVSPAAVTRWRQACSKGDEDAWAGKPHPDGKSRLSPAHLCRLAKLLPKGPRRHGYSMERRTLEPVAKVIAVTSASRTIPDNMLDREIEAEMALDDLRTKPDLLQPCSHGAKLEL